MNNISNIHDCYGCGVCATVCAKQIISIELNGDGFYEPRITDESKCTNCGLCLDVCAYSHDDLSLKDRCIKSYGAWSILWWVSVLKMIVYTCPELICENVNRIKPADCVQNEKKAGVKSIYKKNQRNNRRCPW